MVIWDVETRGVAMTYKDHSMAITSIAWARNGRHLVSGALDETAVLWNVETNSRQARVELTAAVTKVGWAFSANSNPLCTLDLCRNTASNSSQGALRGCYV